MASRDNLPVADRSDPRSTARFHWHLEDDDVISLRGLGKTYQTAAGAFAALRGVDVDVSPGELVTLTGRSGSGKSTLLHLVAGIDRPTCGTVTVGGTDLATIPNRGLAKWRGRNVGIVFQFFQLIPTLTAAENVMLPMDLCGTFTPQARQARALELLARVGVERQADKLPATLSGGEQQRVAIARALANDPPVIVADEPTGNLDSETSAGVAALLAELASQGKTVLVVTHERDTFAASRAVVLADGQVVG